MAPVGSKGKNKAQSRDGRRSRSRNTTPISVGPVAIKDEPDPSGPSYLLTSLRYPSPPANGTLEAIFDRSGTPTTIPPIGAFSGMKESLQTDFLTTRGIYGETCDRLMRELVKRKKELEHQQRERELAEREAEERRQNLKKVPRRKDREEERPPAVGAHGLARQDGVDVHKDTSSTLSSPVSQAPASVAGTNAIKPDSATSPAGSEISYQPPPAPTIPHYQTFGPDPSTYDDPTIYHIREVTSETTEEEKKEILGVAEYPHDDLHDLTCGTPPDKDFSNAKPTNQVTASAFANWVEPFIRPLTEEDVTFLRHRDDRSPSVFMVPRRGPRHYRDIWAEEDNAMPMDFDEPKLPPNEPRGDMDQMNDDLTETDAISTGPVLARLLSTMRPERRAPPIEVNGDTMTNGVTNGDMEIDGVEGVNGDTHTSSQPQPPATHMTESAQPTWKTIPLPKPDYAALDDRIMQELRHIGFLSSDDKPDYDAHYDDEVAARLRLLQDELRRVSVVNGARKRRVLELTLDRLAQQEYGTIADDLDGQLNQAYLKRSRNIGKGKKNVKRPGVAQPVGAGGGGGAGVGVAVPKAGLGEPLKSLMERKHKWNSWIGPVVDNGMSSIPKETIFDEEAMTRLMALEEENWGNEAVGEE